jgi:hypothetical protein
MNLNDRFEAIANLPFNICPSSWLDWQTARLRHPIPDVYFINLLSR